jgi:hypothetical protein
VEDAWAGAGGGRDGEVHCVRTGGSCILGDEGVRDIRLCMLSPSWSYEVRLSVLFILGRLAELELHRTQRMKKKVMITRT